MDEEMLRRLRIPEVHWKARIDRIPLKCKYKETISRYIKALASNVCKGQGLYLHGDYGGGKSAIAAICLREAVKYGFIGVWVKAQQLPGYIITGTIFDNEQTFYERACSVPLLVLDEFQIRKEIMFKETIVEDLVRLRIDNKLVTIITSNIGLTQLEKGYPALYSVLQEALYPVKVWGHDFRREMKGKTE